MSRAGINVTDVIDGEAAGVISDGLSAFNDEAVGYCDRKPLGVIARDLTTGAVIGGAIGRSSLGLLFLDLFYLAPEHRGAGLGSKVLRAFEAEGRRRGCVTGVLYTISFQAPGFYERHGWQRFGEVACQPPGTSRVFMSKTL